MMFGLCVTLRVFFPASGMMPTIFLTASVRRSFAIGVTTRPPAVISRLGGTSPPLTSPDTLQCRALHSCGNRCVAAVLDDYLTHASLVLDNQGYSGGLSLFFWLGI
jgi:hypothetical protein